jgi:hypothetical protein
MAVSGFTLLEYRSAVGLGVGLGVGWASSKNQ